MALFQDEKQVGEDYSVIVPVFLGQEVIPYISTVISIRHGYLP